MTPGDRVAQLYPQALGTHFSGLLQHAWVTVGLFFNPGHHTGVPLHIFYSFSASDSVYVYLSVLGTMVTICTVLTFNISAFCLQSVLM
jgi:hypothetical protein